MTQAQAVIETIEKLGGIATLTQINQKIFEVKDCS
jgi:putative heme iron utilization protein